MNQQATESLQQRQMPAGERINAAKPTAQVIQLRPSARLHDPLQLMQDEPPSRTGRIVLRTACILLLAFGGWATVGKVDIVAPAEGKLATQSLLKVVQPAEPGVIKEILVNEGDLVKAGQVLARLDATLASADRSGISNNLAMQNMQERRIAAELSGQPMLPQAGDDPTLYARVHAQYIAHRQALIDAVEQEKSLLARAGHEKRSAMHVVSKLEQTLPTFRKSAEAFSKLEKEGFISGLSAADKQREAIEKARDLDAQQSTVAALNATIAAQSKKIRQLQSAYQSELERELSDVRARIVQLEPTLDKTVYRESLMELRAPQDGIIKDLATTTIGAVVQPGSVVLTLIPKDEPLYADVNIRNEDVGFVQVGQLAQVKLAAYPFQKYGMLTGQVVHISADATESNTRVARSETAADHSPAPASIYKARVKLDSQALIDPQGNKLSLTPGMQMVAEINQGKRTVLEYLLSPVQKAVGEAGRER